MDIETDIQNHVLTLRMARAAKKNALTHAMYQTMADALAEAGANPEVRAVLILGQSDAFCAGNDLEDFLKDPPVGDDVPVFRFLRTLTTFEKPLVAAVCGVAVGVGTTLLLHCDLVYAGDNARFSLPFVGLGLCPEAASSLLLPLIAGPRFAAEKLMLGEAFSAEEAMRAGLINRVLPQAEVELYARAQANKLASMPPRSLRETRTLLRKSDQDQIQQRMHDEAQLFRALLVAPEAKEAFSAFLEKRKPDFSNFN